MFKWIILIKLEAPLPSGWIREVGMKVLIPFAEQELESGIKSRNSHPPLLHYFLTHSFAIFRIDLESIAS